MNRRDLLRAAALFGGGLGLSGLCPGWARADETGAVLEGPEIDLSIGHAMVNGGHAIGVNSQVPGPLLRFKEGQTVRIRVRNTLADMASIHWHGLLVPPRFDGVPGLSFPGITPGRTFTYELPLIQAGTYWYHSHSGMQEADGVYGPILVEPAEADPHAYDRQHVLVLSEQGLIHPHELMKRLKQDSGFSNYQKQTLGGLLAGRDQSLAERLQWAEMRMDPTDISDLTGAVMTFLVNGQGPSRAWSGLFKPGERVRLRLINAAAQMIFDVRIPGLAMTVVQADGQDVRPVTVDELQIGNAETYDVILTPEDHAYALVAEAVDRSGMVHAVLAPRAGMAAAVPPLRARPLASMRDMGMDMQAMKMGKGPAAQAPAAAPGLATPMPRGSDAMDMRGMKMSMRDPQNAPNLAETTQVQMIAPIPLDRTGEAGQGLRDAGHRVLVYRDLAALAPNPDLRPPSREMEIRLTGNMERFSWGFDGRAFSEGPPPYRFTSGERVRVTLVNDTMMAHPIHLHGHYFELVDGPEGHRPRKHTVIVAPGGKVAWDFTPVAGDWAFHCHMLYHMHAGMFQVFAVRDGAGAKA